MLSSTSRRSAFPAGGFSPEPQVVYCRLHGGRSRENRVAEIRRSAQAQAFNRCRSC